MESKRLSGIHTWEEAIAAQGGGWRLPNIFELLDLCKENTKETIQGCWSASPYAGNDACAWLVNFDNGDDYALIKSLNYCVRLVRGEPVVCRPVCKKEIKAYKLKQQKATGEIASTTKHKTEIHNKEKEMSTILSIKETEFEYKGTDYDGFVVELEGGDGIEELCFGVSNSRDCCEHWGCIISDDSFEDYLGAKLNNITEVDKAYNSRTLEAQTEADTDRGDAAFLNLDTSKGMLQFALYNDHSGYYGHDYVYVIGDDMINKGAL